jgi:hypothetical protein
VNWPAAHFLHCPFSVDAPAKEAVPAEQLVSLHWVVVPGENWPAMQFAQLLFVVEAPVGEACPLEQVVFLH